DLDDPRPGDRVVAVGMHPLPGPPDNGSDDDCEGDRDTNTTAHADRPQRPTGLVQESCSASSVRTCIVPSQSSYPRIAILGYRLELERVRAKLRGTVDDQLRIGIVVLAAEGEKG